MVFIYLSVRSDMDKWGLELYDGWQQHRNICETGSQQVAHCISASNVPPFAMYRD